MTQMHNRREYDENEQITVGFKAAGYQVNVVHDAAAAKGLSTSAYLKGLVLEWAASDLGLPKSAVADRELPAPDVSEATIATARLEQTIADATAALNALKNATTQRRSSRPPPPQRAASGLIRAVR